MESDAGAHGATYDIRNQLTATSGSATLLFRGTLDEAGAVAVNGKPARMLSDRVFEADVAVVPGENTVTVEAWDSAGNKKTDLFTLTQPAGSASFQYDANGNLTQKLEGSDTWNYEWDAENQLERVLKNGAEVARFLYDPLGRRVQKIAGGVSHEYVYDGQDILRESRSDGIVYTYAHGPGIDEPLARVSNTGPTVYYHADGLGSIVATTDSGGTVTSRRQYDAWGNLELGADQPGYAFTGREWDPETSLYYYRNRYYDPETARFLSEDPIGFAGGNNFYAYVGNNPINFFDPLGLKRTASWIKEPHLASITWNYDGMIWPGTYMAADPPRGGLIGIWLLIKGTIGLQVSCTETGECGKNETKTPSFEFSMQHRMGIGVGVTTFKWVQRAGQAADAIDSISDIVDFYRNQWTQLAKQLAQDPMTWCIILGGFGE